MKLDGIDYQEISSNDNVEFLYTQIHKMEEEIKSLKCLKFYNSKYERLFKGTPEEYIRARAAKHRDVYNDPKQAARLFKLADEVQRMRAVVKAAERYYAARNNWDTCLQELVALEQAVEDYITRRPIIMPIDDNDKCRIKDLEQALLMAYELLDAIPIDKQDPMYNELRDSRIRLRKRIRELLAK